MVANQIGTVQQRIRRHCADGDVIPTPSGNSSFTIIRIDSDGVRILSGESMLPLVPWDALEQVPPFLLGRDNVEIAADFKSTGKPGTLDGYFKTAVSQTMVSSFVAAILVQAGVVEYVQTRPRGVRLII